MVIVLATKTMKIVQKIVNQNLPVKLQVVMIAG